MFQKFESILKCRNPEFAAFFKYRYFFANLIVNDSVSFSYARVVH
ncbi:conserved hypothetical protein [Leptospira interrogans serovar Manilae]|uniref:Uncharacterized protein n=1 Tax=Leptospira interrogans serovar Manilae TaxID=214675 RepID=A0AAQ1SPF5_LEPIR|nr:conserved hypothetical protein [Leptospira interrogans serovar Manilae]